MSVDTSGKTEDLIIVSLRERSRGFHFCAKFHIADVMSLADRCSISCLAVQLWWFRRLSESYTMPVFAKLLHHFMLM